MRDGKLLRLISFMLTFVRKNVTMMSGTTLVRRKRNGKKKLQASGGPVVVCMPVVRRIFRVRGKTGESSKRAGTV